MIIRSKSRRRRTWQQLLTYTEKGTDRDPLVIAHNLSGSKVAEWVDEFREAEDARLHRRKDSVVLYHEIMSFHDRDTDKLSKEMLDDLALTYIRLRAGRGLVVAMSHHDRDHVHVHFCISGVEHSTGRSMRMDRSQFTAVKRTMQAYQQENYPELRHSIADHGRKARQVRSEPEYQMKQRTGKPSTRETLAGQVARLFQGARSADAFEKALAGQGLELYRRGGRPQGVRSAGVKYRFTSLGIGKDELERLGKASSRLDELARMRERSRERDREAGPARERLARSHGETSGKSSTQ